MTDEELQRAYAAWLADATAARPAPPPVEALLQVVDGRGGEAERLALLDAALARPDTAREFALLHAARRSSGIADAGRSLPWRRWALAAAGVLAVGVTGALAWRQLVPADPLRGTRGPVVVTDEWRDRPLAWRAVPGAVEYRVEIVSAEGDSVQTLRTRDTALARLLDLDGLPADARWRVVAVHQDGALTASPFRVLTRRRAE